MTDCTEEKRLENIEASLARLEEQLNTVLVDLPLPVSNQFREYHRGKYDQKI